MPDSPWGIKGLHVQGRAVRQLLVSFPLPALAPGCHLSTNSGTTPTLAPNMPTVLWALSRSTVPPVCRTTKTCMLDLSLLFSPIFEGTDSYRERGVFPITDWYYGAADEIQHSLIPPPGAPPRADNVLFNGVCSPYYGYPFPPAAHANSHRRESTPKAVDLSTASS